MSASHLRLPPGLPVLRRDDRHLQVGLEPGAAVVLPDAPEVRRVLAQASTTGVLPAADDLAAARAVRALADRGLLVDPAQERSRRAALAACRVAVDAAPATRSRLGSLLASVGLEPIGDGAADPTVLLVVRAGEAARDDLDAATREGLPHLLVRAQPGSVTIGPFVSPGRTACLRCLDAHLATTDPRWALLAEQAADAEPVPADPVLEPLALTWAAGDLRAWAEGGLPTTWSATVRFALGDDSGPVYTRQEWPRHPGCGCAWGTGLDAG